MSSIFSYLKRNWRIGLFAVVAGGAAWNWLGAASRAWNSIGFRYAHNYAEPVVAAVVLRIPSYPLLYHNFHLEPFIINPYNPLYFYLSYAGMLILGEPMAGGRLVSWIAGTAACLFLYLALRKLGTGRILAILAALLFIRIPAVSGQWASMRPDFTALALSLGSLVCFLEHERRKTAEKNPGSPASGARFYVAGILLSFLAYFTKQNFLTVAASYFLYLVSERRIRDAVRFGIIFGLATAVPTLLWNHATHGIYLLNQQMSVQKPFYGFLFLHFWKDFLLAHGPMFVLAAGGLFFCVRSGLARIVGFYFVLTLAASVTLGKIGADTNYFMEMSAVICLLLGIFFDRAIRGGIQNLRVRWTVAAAICLVMAQSVIAAKAVAGHPNPRPAVKSGLQTAAPDTYEFDQLTAFLEKIDGPIFAENMGFLIAAKKPILYEPFEFTQLAAAGVWDEQKILGRLEKREFPIVLLETNLWKVVRSSRFSTRFVETLRRNYRPVKRVGGQIICVPVTAIPASGPSK